MGWRLRSIRQRILLLVLVPVLSLIGLYIFATAITARDAINLARTDTLKNATGVPTGAYLSALDAERPVAMVYLAAPTGANLAALEMMEGKTNGAVQQLRVALTSSGTTGNASASEKAAIATVLKDAAGLRSLRSQIASQIITRAQAFTDYNNIVGDGYHLLNQTILQEVNVPVAVQSLAFVRLGRSEEMLLREDALLISDLAARSFPTADRAQFAELVGARRALDSETMADLTPVYRAYYVRDVDPRAAAALAAQESTVISDHLTTGPPPVRPVAWQKAVGAVSAGFSQAGTQASAAITARARDTARSTYLRLILTGGIGLLAVLLSIIVSLGVGRGLVRELAALRDSALELANKRLPDVVARLREGEDVDVPAADPVSTAKTDEIGQVKQAFASVQQTAVEAAVGQAQLRRGISDIFRNLARRSQSLLHRQLALLDTMERRAREPEELEDLFRIDHLTTRMRRHAESLIILSGDAPARGWRNPVPLVDVLRAAVAEVEDYTRIKVTTTTRAALAGSAVGDIIHMIAELAENAAIFSPPNTPVLISGDIVGRGFAVEIEDRGLGVSDEKIAEINERLENPPPFDLSGSDQLGLFVAGQLAKRQDVRISLRRSPYGGTTAIVLIPINLVVPEGSYDKHSAGTVDDRAIPLTGRHAARDGDEPDTESNLLVAVPSHPADDPPETNGLAEPLEFSSDSIWPQPIGSGPDDLAGPGDLDDPGLPRRVRQASLAPQLRSSAQAESATDVADADPLDERSPDEARATMMAMQRGWERGRSIFDTTAKSAEPVAASGPAGDRAPAADNGNGDMHHGDE